MVSHRLRPVLAHGVEAQAQSVLLAQRAIAELPEHDSAVSVEHADFRDARLGTRRFDLVTGSPPYFPVGSGVLPDDAQRRACRFEIRGGIEGYVDAAARAMTDAGQFVVVFQTRWADRVLASANSHGLHLRGQADFVMRSDRQQPFLSVFEFARAEAPTRHRFRCAVRTADGEISSEYQQIRRELGVA